MQCTAGKSKRPVSCIKQLGAAGTTEPRTWGCGTVPPCLRTGSPLLPVSICDPTVPTRYDAAILAGRLTPTANTAQHIAQAGPLSSPCKPLLLDHFRRHSRAGSCQCCCHMARSWTRSTRTIRPRSAPVRNMYTFIGFAKAAHSIVVCSNLVCCATRGSCPARTHWTSRGLANRLKNLYRRCRSQRSHHLP